MHRAVVAGALLLLSAVGQPSEALCSPTIFYRDCWIRRFPGLLLDLEESQKQGAQLLRYYTENTGQNCGRSCCLRKDVSCNLAVFYHDPMHDSANCLHAYCPTLESCILAPGLGAVLYNITEGVDPDLLVFQQATSYLNTRSSHGWRDRPRILQAMRVRPGAGTELHPSRPTSGAALPATRGWGVNTYNPELPQDLSTDVWVGLTALGGSVPTEGHETAPHTRSTPGSYNTTMAPTFLLAGSGPSRAPLPSQLNSSKQLPNKTKGSPGSGGQRAEEGGAAPTRGPGTGMSWLVPVALCVSVISLCWTVIAAARGCRGKQQQGQNTLGQRRLGSRPAQRSGLVRASSS